MFITSIIIVIFISTIWAGIWVSKRIPINLDDIELVIETEEGPFSYGDSIDIKLIIKNSGNEGKFIHFNGYGGDLYEFEISPIAYRNNVVFEPNANALSRYMKKQVFIPPMAEKTYDLEWDLFQYSRGGCGGPNYGDLAQPGNYSMYWWLNLDDDFHGDQHLEKQKNFEIVNLTNEIFNFDFSINIPDNKPLSPYNIERETNYLIVEYTPPYSSLDFDFNIINITGRIFENNFIKITIMSEDFKSQGFIELEERRIISISITLESQSDQFIICIYDENMASIWPLFGYSPIYITTI